jgi:hypothetical protein
MPIAKYSDGRNVKRKNAGIKNIDRDKMSKIKRLRLDKTYNVKNVDLDKT